MLNFNGRIVLDVIEGCDRIEPILQLFNGTSTKFNGDSFGKIQQLPSVKFNSFNFNFNGLLAFGKYAPLRFNIRQRTQLKELQKN